MVDGAGNDLQRSEAVWVDTTSPTIVLEGPEDGLVTSMDYVEVKGKLLWDEREIFPISAWTRHICEASFWSTPRERTFHFWFRNSWWSSFTPSSVLMACV